jgi:NADPH2:quinone reductase
MRAIVVTEHGGPEVLDLQDRPDPSPGPGELLVAVEAIGVNFRDVYEREGKGTHVSETPHPAGVEGAGTVSAVGEGVTRFGAGDRSCGATRPAPTRSRCWSPTDAAVGLPDGISSEVAAAAILQGTTAHYLATSTYPIQEGDWVMVHAAAGGVGLLLTQIAKRRGGRVIADHLDGREGGARPRRGRGRDDRLRRLRGAGARADRRRGRARGLRRDR